jgi:hypothetical protein
LPHKSTAVRGFIYRLKNGAKYLLCSQEHPFSCLKAQPHYPPRRSAVYGSNPKECAKPGTWQQLVLTNPVHCCSAFAHTSNAPTTLDPRCSAPAGLSRRRRTTHGQAIGSGQQAAAPVHRIHHSNDKRAPCALSAAPGLDMLGVVGGWSTTSASSSSSSRENSHRWQTW